MNRRLFLTAAAAASIPALGFVPGARAQNTDDVDAPSVKAPRRAIVLFDGKDLSRWVNRKDGQPAGWKVENGYVEVTPGVGDILSTQPHGDGRLHLEFWVPFLPEARGQARGNSGVYLQSHYEIQVLDSYGLKPQNNDCGALYEVAAPLKNACKKPERWQTYDITFRAPRFDASGKQAEKGRVTVYQNGELIQKDTEFDAKVTRSGAEGDLTKPGPLMLQDHGCKVRYRNIWFVPAQQ